MGCWKGSDITEIGCTGGSWRDTNVKEAVLWLKHSLSACLLAVPVHDLACTHGKPALWTRNAAFSLRCNNMCYGYQRGELLSALLALLLRVMTGMLP